MQSVKIKSILKMIVVGVLVALLNACQEIGPGPNIFLVEQGILMYLSQTQGQFIQQLGTQSPELEITRITIKKQQPLLIETLQGFHLQGKYDLKIHLPKREIIQPNKPFDLYFQRQKKAQTWRLAVPSAGGEPEKNWTTYGIQPRSHQY